MSKSTEADGAAADAGLEGAEHLTRLGSVLGEHGAVIGDHGATLHSHGEALDRHGNALDEHGAVIDGLSRRLLSLEDAGTADALAGLARRVADLELERSLRTFTDWIAQVPPVTDVRISIVLPTRNRAAFLPRAVASVFAQRHADWELVVVDDGSEDETPRIVAGYDDPRVRLVRQDSSAGVAMARNRALAEATGDVIAYLDDDNTMHPLWLTALAWAFGRDPDLTVAYGGFVVDGGAGSLPTLRLHAYSRAELLEHNLADMGAIAHRAGLAEARFDESLTRLSDWDLLCSLTAAHEPLVIPAVACYYTTDAPHRLSEVPTLHADHAALLAKHAAR